jgi:hypothetical protein
VNSERGSGTWWATILSLAFAAAVILIANALIGIRHLF